MVWSECVVWMFLRYHVRSISYPGSDMATPPSDDATKRPADSLDVDDAADDAPIDEKSSSSLKKKGKKKGKKQKSREGERSRSSAFREAPKL